MGVLVLPVEIPTRFTHLWDEGKPRPYNINVFLVLPMRVPLHCFRLASLVEKRNRLAVGYLPYVTL
ncbi:MAG: hypothetical protein LBQ66_13270 [Planctomycetaceae bacterium]|nr:hypothetical protein [Planctomycetaceae bacterium]